MAFDAGPDCAPLRFEMPVRVISAATAEEVPRAFAEMEAARQAGRWLAGFASYELGYCLSAKLAPLLPEGRDLPLLSFGVFERPIHGGIAMAGRATLTRPVPLWDRARYFRAFARLQDYIAAGHIYQANLTFPLAARARGTPAALYAALSHRQPVGYGALIEMPDGAILCRSPELFVEIDAEGRILTRPMKGTAPRGRTATEDATLRDRLAVSEKDRAENLMIVDLLRNDVARIARIGSVRVPRLFEVESYETLHQMVSEIAGRAREGITLDQVFTALFPCGSVTGAPKIRAMEIIRELEDAPRGAYCGATGWIAPDGALRLGVAIRTLTMWKDGSVRLNVGGGVVHDSTGAGEYEEALWKAKFADLSRPA